MKINKPITTKEIVNIAIFAVIILVCSFITIPFAVPFTMQTFAVYMALEILGGKNGTFSIVIYVFIGGIKALFTATGGYVIGFILMGLTHWAIKSLFKDNVKSTVASMIIGTFLCYTFGTIWYMVVYMGNTGYISLLTALSWCVFPFIVPDIFKLGLALTLSKKVKNIYLKKNGKPYIY